MASARRPGTHAVEAQAGDESGHGQVESSFGAEAREPPTSEIEDWDL